MALLGQAAIAIWNDIAPEGRATFDEWHPREHMPERVDIPGFLRGRRYAATRADIEYFTLYEAQNLDVLTGPDYRARLDQPTPWSVETVRHFRSNLRGICRVGFSHGHADGAHLATVRLSPRAGEESKLETALREVAFTELAAPRLCGIHLLATEPALSGTRTTLQASRAIGLPAWIVMIEAATAAAAEQAAARIVAIAGEGETPITGFYALEYGIVAGRP